MVTLHILAEKLGHVHEGDASVGLARSPQLRKNSSGSPRLKMAGLFFFFLDCDLLVSNRLTRPSDLITPDFSIDCIDVPLRAGNDLNDSYFHNALCC